MTITEVPDDESLEIVRPEVSARPEIGEILESVRLLLTDGTIEDADDRKTIEEALAFLENPTEDFEEIKRHLKDIGMVLAYNYREIKDQPPALNDINRRLFTLASQQCINLIEAELKNKASESQRLQELLMTALNFTGVLVKYYDDSVLHSRVIEIQEQLGDEVL